MAKIAPAASIIIVNRKGQALVQLRDERPEGRYPNQVGLFGGGIEPGETPEQAIVREAAEELGGYALKEFSYFGKFNEKGRDIYVYVKYDPDFTIESHEITEGRGALFISGNELDRDDFIPATKLILEEFFRALPELRNNWKP